MKFKKIFIGIVLIGIFLLPILRAYAVAWNVTDASFVDSFDVSGEDSSPRDLVFNTDGTKMFITGGAGIDINEYTLSTGFDVSTASFVDSLDVSTEDTSPQGLAFNSDGTKMFVAGTTDDDVYEYTLSTGFDVSTASFVDSFSIGLQMVSCPGLDFNTDGTKMFVFNGYGIYLYNLSTGFDVSTAVYSSEKSITSGGRGFVFKPDGMRLFYSMQYMFTYNVCQRDMSSAFDIASAGAFTCFDYSGEDTSARGVAFNSDGTKMFVVGDTGDDVNEYSLVDEEEVADDAMFFGVNF